MKTNQLFYRVLAVALSVFTVLNFFVPFVTQVIPSNGILTYKKGFALNQFAEIFTHTNSNTLLIISKILFYIAFAVIIATVLLILIQLLIYKVKAIDVTIKILGFSLIGLSVASFLFNLIWCILNKTSNELYSITFWPWIGGFVLLIFGVSAGILTILLKNDKPEQKGSVNKDLVISTINDIEPVKSTKKEKNEKDNTKTMKQSKEKKTNKQKFVNKEKNAAEKPLEVKEENTKEKVKEKQPAKTTNKTKTSSTKTTTKKNDDIKPKNTTSNTKTITSIKTNTKSNTNTNTKSKTKSNATKTKTSTKTSKKKDEK